MAPSPRLLLLALAGIVLSALPLFVQPSLWVVPALMWSVLAGAMAFDTWILWRAAPVVRATPPAALGVGDSFEIPVELELVAAPAALRATLRSEVQSPLASAGDTNLKAGVGKTPHIIRIDAPRRGKGELSAVWSRVDGPLGTMRRVERHELALPISVIPNAERVRELAVAHFGSQPTGGAHIQKRTGDGGELDYLEAYQPGMDLRKVDWKSTARHQNLQIRRFRSEQNQRIILCADTGRLMADPIEGVQRLDHAIHSMLLLASVALKGGDLVGVHGYDAQVRGWAPPGGGPRQLARVRKTLASLRAAPEETNHVIGVHHLLGHLKRRSLIVVFTEFTDSTTAELMIDHLAHLARRHLVVFVALDDPAIETPMLVAPKTASDLTRTIVAGELRQNRERVLRRLRRSGVDVISGPPGPAALRLLERYVRIKRRGLIG